VSEEAGRRKPTSLCFRYLNGEDVDRDSLRICNKNARRRPANVSAPDIYIVARFLLNEFEVLKVGEKMIKNK